MNVTVEAVAEATAADWLRLRSEFWPSRDPNEHRVTLARFFTGEVPEPAAAFLARDETGRAIGLIELSIRAYAEGCHQPNPAYVEGVYVVPDCRLTGVASQLLAQAEQWARAQGCRDLASDSDPANKASAALHTAAGFRDIGVVRCWAKRLG